MPKKFLIISLCFWCSWKVAFSQFSELGRPNLVNYSKSDYKAGTQNWGIAQDSLGIIYFANNEGVLSFNGSEWTLLRVSESKPVRSIFVSDAGTIFIGLLNDFGYLRQASNGAWQFTSLQNQLSPTYESFDEIWKIFEIEEGVVFQSFEFIFIWNEENLRVVEPNNRFHFAFPVNGRVWVQEQGLGLFEYLNGSKSKLKWSVPLRNMEIVDVIPLGIDHLLICTDKNGLFKYVNGELSAWDTPINSILKKERLFKAKQLNKGTILYATVLGGLLESSLSGEVVNQIDSKKGLQNNTILSMHIDQQKNLWLGLDNGISYLETNSPITYIKTSYGSAAGYDAIIYDRNIYLGTNQGLYRKQIIGPSKGFEGFELIPQTSGQVWSLKVLNNTLLCGHDAGAFEVKGGKARQIGRKEGAWTFLIPQNHDDLMLVGHYSGLAVYEETAKGWAFRNEIKGFENSCRFVLEDANGYFWVSHGSEGIYQLQIDEGFDSILKARHFTNHQGLPSIENNKIIQWQDRVVFSTTNGIYKFDYETDRFVYDEGLNELLGIRGRLKILRSDSIHNIWFISSVESGVLERNPDKSYTKISMPFTSLDGSYLNEFESIYPFDGKYIFFGLDNGFAMYSTEFNKDYQQSFPMIISRLELGMQDSAIHQPPEDKEVQLEYKQNNISFHFSAISYENAADMQYAYFLDGFSETWSSWTLEPYKDFSNLREGSYEFFVKAKNIYGVESAAASLKIFIKPPWYRSHSAYVIYFLGLLIFFAGLTVWVQFLIRKNKAKQLRFYQQELDLKQQEFENQKVIAEKEIIKLRNEKLKTEMIHRDKELANQTMNIVQKNNVLSKLIEELNEIKKSATNPEVRNTLEVLSMSLEREAGSDNQFQVFRNYFDEVHDEFYSRLKKKHPELTAREMNLCAFIRMDLSTKEIASLLNISARGVEISRYRVRKKMKLSRQVNLSVYLSLL